VLPVNLIEAQVNSRGFYAAGFIGYEGGTRFRSGLEGKIRPVRVSPPLVRLYKKPDEHGILPPSSGNAPQAPLDWTPSINRANYEHCPPFMNYLYCGDTYQVNYTFRLSAPFSGDPWPFFIDWCALNRPAMPPLPRRTVCALLRLTELFFQTRRRPARFPPDEGHGAARRTPPRI